jgi:hypothetical protein
MTRDTILATIVNIEVNINKLYIYFYINLSNLLNFFGGGIGMNMCKSNAPHPSGGMGSSNPCRWRGDGLHHHGDGMVFGR